MITLRQLAIGYGATPLFPPLSGQFTAGSLTAVVGVNGAGKSTLLKTFAGLLPPLGGSLSFIGGKPPRRAYLPQQAELDRQFPIAVSDLVAMGCWPQSGMFGGMSKRAASQVNEALASVGMSALAHTPVGELSGGQLQRGLFARLLVQQAPLILLDEPFTGIDSATTQILLQVIAQLHRQGKTVIAVLHDMSMVAEHFSQVGVLYAFINYLGRLNEPLIELTSQQSILQQAVVAGERIFELMDRSQQSYGADDRPLAGGRIDITDLSFAYRADKKVLQHISLAVPSRGFVALVGHTGSGKSTLANLLMGYYPVSEGEVRLDGRPISSLSHRTLRQGVAMVQQDPVVIADSVLANVTLGRNIEEDAVWRALETVQLASLVRGFLQGIHTRLGEQGNNLSVGQKQLLAMARVLVQAPQILILDEATANIDSGTEQAIQRALRAIREHTTLVVIAHRLSTIVDADSILVLHRGQAVEQGNHQQLLAQQGRYYQMYQLQLAGEQLAEAVREESQPA